MFLFLDAAATAQQGGGLGNYTMIIMLVAVFGIMYFLMIRPEQKKKKEAEQLRANLKKGDKITTIGGIVGKIVNIKDDNIVIEIGEDQVRMELQKWSVMTNNSAEKEKAERKAAALEDAKKRKEEAAHAKKEKKESKGKR